HIGTSGAKVDHMAAQSIRRALHRVCHGMAITVDDLHASGMQCLLATDGADPSVTRANWHDHIGRDGWPLPQRSGGGRGPHLFRSQDGHETELTTRLDAGAHLAGRSYRFASIVKHFLLLLIELPYTRAAGVRHLPEGRPSGIIY